MDGRFTDEELAIAKSVDLCSVAESLGYTVKRIGKYHTLKEMDSIRIYNRSHWYRWSRQFDKGNNGGSQIDFLRVFCGMSVKEAVFWLLDFAGYRRIEKPVKQPLVHQVSQKQAEERKPFVLPELAGDNSYLISYLNQERGISRAVIDLFLKDGLIYESRHYHNVVFKGNDKNGVTRFASMRGVFDKQGNFIIGMLYTQIFQELYYQADFNCGGRLPIHVTFMLDEFANVALPDDFCSLLSTMRSREISSIIIIQNFAQLKALFKDTWETIPGNCDTFIYLGGNEQSTHKYVSELLGKGTIDKKSSGETKGRQGSSSRNYDVLGRELFTPDEVRKLDNKKCIIFIRGFDPIMDNKFIPFNHPMFNQTADGKGEPYVHAVRGTDNLIGPPFEILSEKAVKYYEKLKDKGENVYIDSLTYEQFMMLGDAELSRRFSMQDEAEQKAKIDREQANELEYVDESQKSEATESANASSGSAGAKPVRNPEREKPKWEDTITNRMLHWSYTPEQKEEVKKALAAGVPKATILTYFYPEVTVEKMSFYRKKQ